MSKLVEELREETSLQRTRRVAKKHLANARSGLKPVEALTAAVGPLSTRVQAVKRAIDDLESAIERYPKPPRKSA